MNDMKNQNKIKHIAQLSIIFILTACGIKLTQNQRAANKNVPTHYFSPFDSALTHSNVLDTFSSGAIKWRDFFKDTFLVQLIDSALVGNQELNIITQEITIARNEVRARKGEYLPFVNAGGSVGADKVGQYTRNGALESNLNIQPGKAFPEALPDFSSGLYSTWEVDIWHKLRNAKKAAYNRFLASVESRNFMVTQLVAELSSSYYELLALDNQVDILNKNIEILKNAVEIIKLQKIAARVTELAVRKFEAELYKNQSQLYYFNQRIAETENHINFLTGSYLHPIKRNKDAFYNVAFDSLRAGLPSVLLTNRPDIKQAELNLQAADLDVKVARASFYPSLRIMAGFGTQAYQPKLLPTPESLVFALAGDLAGPLVNRNGLKATFYSANARQQQAAFGFEKTVLNAFVEVSTQLSNMSNLEKSYAFKQQQVQTLTESITIAYNLFKSARADYMEVLMTQRDGLEAKMELVETKMLQLNAMIDTYRALGGGWR